jgi:hypothetical protein
MDNETVTGTAATVSKCLKTVNGWCPDRGLADPLVLSAPWSAGQLLGWVADGLRTAHARQLATLTAP